MNRQKRFVCLRCNYLAAQLFERPDMTPGTKRLAICVNCGQVVDEYAEQSGINVAFHMLCSKPLAFRHVIFNRNFKVLPLLLILSLIAEAYCLMEKDPVGSQAYYSFCRQCNSIGLDMIRKLGSILFGSNTSIQNYMQITCKNCKTTDGYDGIFFMSDDFLRKLTAVMIDWLDAQHKPLVVVTDEKEFTEIPPLRGRKKWQTLYASRL